MRSPNQITSIHRRAGTAQAMTVATMATRYLSARENEHSEITKRHYVGALKRLTHFANLTIDRLTPAGAQAIYDAIRAEHGIHTADKAIKLAGASWTLAARLDECPQHNPWRAVRKVPKQQRPIYFPSGWLPSMLELNDRTTTIAPYAARCLSFCLGSGARPKCEVLALRTEDIDLNDGVIIIRKGKGRRARLIPLSLLGEVGIASLRAQLEMTSGWLWPSPVFPGKPMSDKPLREAWQHLRSLAAAEGMRTTTLDGKPLDLYAASRHAVASFAGSELGLSLAHIASLLGNSVKTLEKHYLHLSIAHAEPSAAAIGKAFDAVRRPTSTMSSTCTNYGVDPAKLRAARQGKGLTQEAAAKASGLISRQAFALWEAGKGSPSIEQLQRFAACVGVEVSALLKGAA